MVTENKALDAFYDFEMSNILFRIDTHATLTSLSLLILYYVEHKIMFLLDISVIFLPSSSVDNRRTKISVIIIFPKN